ncbi:hypothetical protein PIB30_049511 [Stylosanthes scabra]|uniref:Uncharacterized protein n=1 Tax=Stylosanthes scabra TaxID=79078 RepID=A0ABU6TH13_9FABA|nr:hypothetical protein [Stylosanthes scabra]
MLFEPARELELARELSLGSLPALDAVRAASISIGVVHSSIINRKNEDYHIATALDIWRQDGFWQAVMLMNFHFDFVLLSTFVKRWRPKMHRFHMPWGKAPVNPEARKELCFPTSPRVPALLTTHTVASLLPPP